MNALSVIIITYNEEPDIEACLESVAWADEIVVVDCGSADRTVEVCRRYTDRVSRVERHGSGQQKQDALDQATMPWVLNVDADERVSPDLKQEIQAVLSRDVPYDGYCIPRRSRFLGRTIRHAGWGSDRPLRLFRRSNVRVTATQVHEGFIVDGPVGTLTTHLEHDAYKSLYQYIEKLNEYTSIEVRNRLRAQPDRRIGWTHLMLAPLSFFWKTYVVKRGFLDGFHGLLLCVLSSISVMIGYAKVWEYQMRHREGKGWFPPIRTEEVRSRQPGYNRLHVGGDDEFRWDETRNQWD